jgi:hypothetical protein
MVMLALDPPLQCTTLSVTFIREKHGEGFSMLRSLIVCMAIAFIAVAAIAQGDARTGSSEGTRLNAEMRHALEAGDIEKARAMISPRVQASRTAPTRVIDRASGETIWSSPDVTAHIDAFFCSGTRCICAGLEDCVDLAETGICKEKMVCEATTCTCDR